MSDKLTKIISGNKIPRNISIITLECENIYCKRQWRGNYNNNFCEGCCKLVCKYCKGNNDCIICTKRNKICVYCARFNNPKSLWVYCNMCDKIMIGLCNDCRSGGEYEIDTNDDIYCSNCWQIYSRN